MKSEFYSHANSPLNRMTNQTKHEYIVIVTSITLNGLSQRYHDLVESKALRRSRDSNYTFTSNLDESEVDQKSLWWFDPNDTTCNITYTLIITLYRYLMIGLWVSLGLSSVIDWFGMCNGFSSMCFSFGGVQHWIPEKDSSS